METRVVAAITLKSPRPVMTLTRPKDLTAAQLAAEPRSNPSINDVTRSGRIYQPAQLRGPVAVAPEIPPPARRAEVAESYDVAQHLKRIPAEIRSITNLAANFIEMHFRKSCPMSRQAPQFLPASNHRVSNSAATNNIYTFPSGIKIPHVEPLYITVYKDGFEIHKVVLADRQ